MGAQILSLPPGASYPRYATASPNHLAPPTPLNSPMIINHFYLCQKIYPKIVAKYFCEQTLYITIICRVICTSLKYWELPRFACALQYGTSGVDWLTGSKYIKNNTWRFEKQRQKYSDFVYQRFFFLAVWWFCYSTVDSVTKMPSYELMVIYRTLQKVW